MAMCLNVMDNLRDLSGEFQPNTSFCLFHADFRTQSHVREDISLPYLAQPLNIKSARSVLAAITIMAVATAVLLHVRFPTHTPTGEVPIFLQAEESELLRQCYLQTAGKGVDFPPCKLLGSNCSEHLISSNGTIKTAQPVPLRQPSEWTSALRGTCMAIRRHVRLLTQMEINTYE